MSAYSFEAANYEYVVTRVRHRRASLFDEEDYQKLLRMGSGEIARFMEETEYEREVNELGSRYAGVDLIEYALNRNLARHFDDLLRWSEGVLYERVARYLRKFDAWNLKTALRGVYSEANADEIADDFIRAGEFDDQYLSRLANAASVEEVVDLADGTTFGAALEEAESRYEETGMLVPLENAVDRTYYEGLLENADADPGGESSRYVQFLQAEIDFRNVRNALRLARSGSDLDPVEYYIEGGRLFRPAELRQLVTNTDELVARLRDSTYGDELDEALDELEDAESLIGFEHALDAALLEYADHLSHVFSLSVSPVLSYVLAKEREVENVRAVARGREAGLTREEIEDELVIL
ncbi:MAG: V-type ATP synthase subunit C [Halobacteriaceae archaeon]